MHSWLTHIRHNGLRGDEVDKSFPQPLLEELEGRKQEMLRRKIMSEVDMGRFEIAYYLEITLHAVK